MRGEYLWGGVAPQPSGWPVVDVYERDTIYWRIVEPTQGNYNFTLIEAGLANAEARGGKFGLRIMAAGTGVSQYLVPDYVVSGAGGAMATVDTQQWWIPDWNNNFYLTRLEALLTAIGTTFGNDPRFGFVDMSGYGNWGEWHNWPYEFFQITTTNEDRILAANINAFPKQQIFALTSGTLSRALTYAQVGLRSDFLGGVNMSGHETNLINSGATGLNRWQTQPYIVEWGWATNGATLALNQVQTYHMSMISSGNNLYPEGNAADYQMMLKKAGYRYVLNSMTLPATLSSGQPFSCSANWSNVNVAPAYHPWRVMLQLRQGTTVYWQSDSDLELRTLLPGSTTANDSFVLPSLPAGTYNVAVRVLDAERYYDPLNLAITNKQADGSYVLGTIVHSGAFSPLEQETYDFTGSNGAAWPVAWTSQLRSTIQNNRGRLQTTATAFSQGEATRAVSWLDSEVSGIFYPQALASNNIFRVSTRLGGGNRYYFTMHTSGYIQIAREMVGVFTTIAEGAYTFSLVTGARFRILTQGSVLSLKLWNDGSAEPGAWTISGVDTGITAANAIQITMQTETASVVTGDFDDVVLTRLS